MARLQIRRVLGLGVLAASLSLPSSGWAQAPKGAAAAAASGSFLTVDQPDAQRTREELSRLLEHYPPTLRGSLALDPSLFGNESFLAPYPGLASFLNAHPEIARNPSFFVGDPGTRFNQDRATRVVELWR